MAYSFCRYCSDTTANDKSESEMISLCDCLNPVHKRCMIKLLQTDPEPFCWVCSKKYRIDFWVRTDLFFYQATHLFD